MFLLSTWSRVSSVIMSSIEPEALSPNTRNLCERWKSRNSFSDRFDDSLKALPGAVCKELWWLSLSKMGESISWISSSSSIFPPILLLVFGTLLKIMSGLLIVGGTSPSSTFFPWLLVVGNTLLLVIGNALKVALGSLIIGDALTSSTFVPRLLVIGDIVLDETGRLIFVGTKFTSDHPFPHFWL